MEKTLSYIPNVPEAMTLHDWSVVEMHLHGECHIFALALQSVYRYRIVLLWNRTSSGRRLEHAYCIRKDGSFVDARGTVTMEQILENAGHALTNAVFQEVTKAELLAIIEAGELCAPKPRQLWLLRQFITSHANVYRLGHDTLLPLRDVPQEEQRRVVAIIEARTRLALLLSD